MLSPHRQNDLTTTDTSRALILDSNNYQFDVYGSKVENSDGGFSLVGDIMSNSNLANTVASKTNSGVPLG